MSDRLAIALIICNLITCIGVYLVYVGIKLQMKISDALYKKMAALDEALKLKKTASITMKIEPSDEMKDLFDSIKGK